MRTAASLLVVVACAVLGLTDVGPGGAPGAQRRPSPEPLAGSGTSTTATTSTTEAPGQFIEGQLVEFGSAAAPATTTTAVPDPAGPGRSWTWDQLADCETGRWGPGKVPVAGTARWAATRGVYQGGLQFDARTWDAYRDRHVPAFPVDAHLATREQQIAVAERVLAAQGAGAWPTCGPRVGLVGAGTAGVAALPPAGPPVIEPG